MFELTQEQIDKKVKEHLFRATMPDSVVDMTFEWLNANGFFTAPASKKYHGNFTGGLFTHSFIVKNRLIEFTKKFELEWERPESPFIIGMFHDLCKVDQYVLRDGKYVWNDRMELTGHGEKSVLLLERLIDLTDEEKDCIRYHMGAFGEKEEREAYSAAVDRNPNVLWTHTADMLAAHVDNI